MRGKKDNIEWEGNIIGAKCPYCNHTGTREVTNAGVLIYLSVLNVNVFTEYPK